MIPQLHPNFRQLRAALFASLLGLASGWITASPQITSVEPLGLVPGSQTTLTFHGRDLAGVSNLWTSFPAEVELMPGSSEGKITFAVTCPTGVEGIHAVQLIGATGASPFRLLLIDHLKVSSKPEKNAKPFKLVPPTAIDGEVTSENIDIYEIEAKAGQSFSIEAIAHRIGSQMDPVVKVLDTKGKELAFCEDEPGTWRDARFRFTAPLDGIYQIAVHDAAFAGGRNHEYRLRVCNDPLVWSAFPLVDPSEAGTESELVGEFEASRNASPANPPVRMLLSSLPQIGETEPNDDRAKAQHLASLVTINGRLRDGYDVDWFRFDAQKDQRLIFRSQTRSLGSACDLVLGIRAADGSLINESDPSAASDTALTNKFSDSGSYFLEVRELTGYGVTNAPYRIQVKEFNPSFELSTENNVVEIRAGETANLKVLATRFEYDDPIELKLDPEIPGIALENNTIDVKKKEVELTLKAAESLSPATYSVIKLTGKRSGEQRETPVVASTRPALRKSFPLILNPPHTLDGLITIVVTKK